MSKRARNVCLAIGLLIVAYPVLKYLNEFELRRLDKEVDRLCAIVHGGIKVYETVTLPKEKFNQYGQPLVPQGGREDLGFGYYIVNEDQHVAGVREAPGARLTRHVSRIVRTQDGKVLGEQVWYGRDGGDFLEGGMLTPAIGHDCPPGVGWEFPKRVLIQGGSQ